MTGRRIGFDHNQLFKCWSTYRWEPAVKSTVRGSPLWSATLIQTVAILGERWCAENKSPLFLLKLALKLRAEKKNRSYFSSDDCPLTLTPESTTLREKTLADQNIIFLFFLFFLAGKLLSWRGNGLQLSQTKAPLPKSHRGGRRRRKKRSSSVFTWNKSCAYWTSPCGSSARPERLLPLLVASTCAPSGNCGWITGALLCALRPESQSPLWSSAPRQAGRRCPTQLV